MEYEKWVKGSWQRNNCMKCRDSLEQAPKVEIVGITGLNYDINLTTNDYYFYIIADGEFVSKVRLAADRFWEVPKEDQLEFVESMLRYAGFDDYKVTTYLPDSVAVEICGAPAEEKETDFALGLAMEWLKVCKSFKEDPNKEVQRYNVLINMIKDEIYFCWNESYLMCIRPGQMIKRKVPAELNKEKVLKIALDIFSEAFWKYEDVEVERLLLNGEGSDRELKIIYKKI